MKVRTRFAPSPTGYLHLGHLRTALYTYLFAKKYNGVIVLRIEDTDQERYVEGTVQGIFRSLKTVGLRFDEGPEEGGAYGPYVQSERKHLYKPYAEMLVAKDAAYYCFCKKERLDALRAECEQKGLVYKYDKHCLNLTKAEIGSRLGAGEPYVIRQNMPTEGRADFDDLIYGHIEADFSALDDMVLLKSDGMPTYNFANVIDDHLMEITHILRGSEYLSSTPKYNHLYRAFGWEIPAYVHLPNVDIVAGGIRRKLSKRKGDPSFEDLLTAGYLKDAVVNYVALLGWSPGTTQEMFTLQELVEAFSLEGLSKSPAIFDIEKLRWFNAEYARRMSLPEFHEAMLPWIKDAIDISRVDTLRLAEILQPRTEVFGELASKVGFLSEMPDFDTALYDNKKMKSDARMALDMLQAAMPMLMDLQDWSEAGLHDAVMALIERLGVKNGQMLWPLRIAISGRESTPGGAFEIACLLGREVTLKRLDKSIAILDNTLRN
jgi:glutamyl-tRNA synthetase